MFRLSRFARMAEERLQKILSHAGVASRRAAEKMLLDGRVSVNGEIVSELGSKADLSRDHIIPASRGGRDTWMNSVTACRSCNTRKGNRAPEQANMPLIYVPYVPNRHEHFILRNRRILADQMEYLLAGVPRTSRLHLLPRAA